MVDHANLLAEMLSQPELSSPDTEPLRNAFQKASERTLNAEIWSHVKARTDLHIYVTDQQGIVIYDSKNRAEGQDYSRWNDVWLTLKGEYGARSTQQNPKDPASSVMYVAAPVYRHRAGSDPEIVGVVSVGKANTSVQPFYELALSNIQSKAAWLLLAALIVGAFLSGWLSNSIRKLVNYARKLQQEERIDKPRIQDPDLDELAVAMTDLKDALDGKAYIESYLLNFTHEMKSPLTALGGAAELMSDASGEQQQRLASNIKQQSDRMRRLVDKVLALSRLENQSSLDQLKQVSITDTIQQVISESTLSAEKKQLRLIYQDTQPLMVTGDPLLLNQALSNLINNAIDFSPATSEVEITTEANADTLAIHVRDHGCGIPEYAEQQIWQRFYSLPRPDGGVKSTGLGLSFVQEIANLHHGEVSIKNHPDGGAEAVLTLPVEKLTQSSQSTH